MISGVILTRKTPFLPANAYRRICGKRDFVVARYVLHLLGFGRTPEIDEEAVAHVVHRCRLRIAISAHRRDGHLASSFEHREDLLTQTRVHLHLRGTSGDPTHLSLSGGAASATCTPPRNRPKGGRRIMKRLVASSSASRRIRRCSLFSVRLR